MRLFYFILLTCLFGLFTSFELHAQIWKGSSYAVQTFTPNEYKAHAQNWQIAQDENGIIYSANNNGILSFDGVRFRLYETPNNSVVRSIAYDNNRIYYGAQNDFGYLEPDSLGDLSFHSLVQFVDSTERNFRDIWKINVINEDVYFFSLTGLMKWTEKEQRIQVLKPEKFFYFPFLVGDKLLIQEPGKKIGFWIGDSISSLPGDSFFLDKPYFFAGKMSNNGIFIATERLGLFYWKDALIKPVFTEVDNLLKDGQVYSGIQLKNGDFLISTRRNGSFIISEKGEVKQYLTKDFGLPSNTHWNAFEDRTGNIWIATDNGLIQVDINQGLSLLKENTGLSGTIEAITFYKNRLLVASRDGFAIQQDDGSFYYDQKISSDVWDFLAVDDFILITSADGIFTWNGRFSQKVIDSPKGNTWLCLYHDKINNRIYAGATNGFFELIRVGSKWKIKNIDPIKEEIRFILVDSLSNIWLQTSYTGIIKLKESPTGDNPFVIKRFQDGKPLLSNIVRVFQDKNEIIIHDNVNFYKYDAQRDTIFMLPDYREKFEGLKPKEQFFRTYSTQDFTILSTIINDNYFTRIYKNDSLLTEIRTDVIPDYFNSIAMTKIPDQPVFVFGGVQNGLVVDLTKKRGNNTFFKPIIRQVISNWTQIIFRGYFNPLFTEPTFEAPLKTIRFEFASAQYGLESAVSYQVRLIGLDTTWAPLSKESFSEFTNLPDGNYRFEVRQEFPNLRLSDINSFTFSVKNPWYASTWFYVLIGIFALLIVAISSRFISIKPLITKISHLEVEQKMLLERERISKELHDNIGTQLIQIVSGLELAEAYQKKEKKDKALELVHSLRDETRSTITQLRQTVWTLHSGTIYLSECIIRIQDMLQTQLKHHPNIQLFKIINEDALKPLETSIIEPDTALHVFRIIQESCNNSIKYADSTEISVLVDVIHPEKKHIRLSISDNGKGFDISANRSGFGLNNMKERAKLAGFQIQIDSEIGKGTRTQIDWFL